MSDGRVWATRPERQNTEWCHKLAAEGWNVVKLPLLAIEPVQEPPLVQAVKDLVMDFDQFQKVIFVSQNAVEYACEWLDDYWPQRPEGIAYFAVGGKTASVARERGFAVAQCKAVDSEELLATPELTEVWGERILIARGLGGLPRLGRVLHDRGAMVRYLELYRRVLPPAAARDFGQALATSGAHDIIPVFSGETLENLLNLFAEVRVSQPPQTVVVPGKRVAEIANRGGFARVLVAANASETAMLETVRAAAGSG